MAVVDTAAGDVVGLTMSSSPLSSSIQDPSAAAINDEDKSADHNDTHSPLPPSNNTLLINNHENHRSDSDIAIDVYDRNMTELQDLFSKLNPMAEEFVPLSLSNNNKKKLTSALASLHAFDPSLYLDNANTNTNTNTNKYNSFVPLDAAKNGHLNGIPAPKKKNYGQAKRRMNSRTSTAQREEIIRRTVYVSDIDQQVTEEQLAALFVGCGQVVDCRICGDPNSALRFAFIEFTDEEGARTSLNLSGTMLGYYPVKVLPSKTAIAPVNPTYLPRTDDEWEMCTRTIYCTNIDKKVTQTEIKVFFQSVCGEVYRLRLLGDYHHSTRIAFVEFVQAESAIAALNCSGVILGTLPIRVSPSKTPVRPRAPRLPLH